MTGSRQFRRVVYVVVAILLSACAALQRTDPLQVTVAGIEPMQGQGMELRMLVKLRVQNPNESAIDYNGVSVKFDVAGKTFATGVSDAAGTVPRFGESVIEVPVTISAMNMAKQVMSVMHSGGAKMPEKIDYALTGKLSGSMFNSVHFKSSGTLDLPTGPAGATGT